MKRALAMLLTVLMVASLFAGCGGNGGTETTAGNSGSSETTKETMEVITTNPVDAGGEKHGNVTMGPDSDKKTMVVVASKSFETLDPMFLSGAVGARVRTLLWDTLWDMEMGASEEVGLMAKEWSFSEDGMTVYVTMHDNIYDCEGNHITASDVEWSYNKYLENKNLANMTGCVATGEFDLEIGLRYPYYPGYLITAVGNMPIVDSDAYDPDRFRTDPVTTGQYKAIAFTSGASATFMQTYNYWGKDTVELCAHRHANVDVCRFDVITENSQIETALATNAIQTADITANIAENFANTNVQVLTFPESYPAVFMLNNAEGSIFEGNKALREAFAYACDMTSMCLADTRGNGTVSGIFGNDSLSGYSADFAKYAISYDVDTAKAKLAEAGYKEGELTLSFVTNINNEVPVVLQACLQQVGINMEIKLMDETQFLTARQQANLLEWDILMLEVVPKGFLTNILYTLTDVNAYSFGSYCGANDVELFEAVKTARYSQTPEDIEAAYAMMMDRLYYVPTWSDYGYAGAYSKIVSLVKDSSLELIAQASIFADDYDVYYEG